MLSFDARAATAFGRHVVMRPSAVVLRTTGLTVSDRRGPTIAAKHHVSCVIEDIDVIVKPKDNVVRRTTCVSTCVSTCASDCVVYTCTVTVTTKT